MKRYFLLILTAIVSLLPAVAQDLVYTKPDSLRVEMLLRQAPDDADVIYFARKLIGTPYVGHTLEVSNDVEPLVINLRELDCTTYVEVVAALWHTHCYLRTLSGVEPFPVSGQRRLPASQRNTELQPHASGLPAFTIFADYLTRYRYWAGLRRGYCSRHHYFSWWWHDNVAQHLLQEVDLSAAAVKLTPMQVRLSYMSSNPRQYRQLAAHPDWAKQLQPLEQLYSGTDGTYLSQQELLRIGSTGLKGVIKDGDVIAIVTTKAGLDYSHLGFASWQSDGRLHLLNASSIHKRVVDEQKTLYQYLGEHSSSIGVRVFRLM